MVDILTGWTQGRGSSSDLALIDELSEAMRLTSICGLGQVVPAPIASVLKFFREEVEAHILRRECPSGICFSGAAAHSSAYVSAASLGARPS
jgi:NADP-reducing hydrogenase subunit HndC